jgi:O-antigen/teichoic acid export membrane protein
VPILLLANFSLGVYYNLSIWYKLTDKTAGGAYVSLLGAGLTLLFNAWWIPRLGYTGSAWATFACYATMAMVSYLVGQRCYPVPYDLRRLIGYPAAAVLIWLASRAWQPGPLLQGALNLLLLAAFGLAAWRLERRPRPPLPG